MADGLQSLQQTRKMAQNREPVASNSELDFRESRIRTELESKQAAFGVNQANGWRRLTKEPS